MKKKLYGIIILLSVLPGLKLRAQDDIQQVQKEWGKDKRELVQMAMQLSAADSVKFWPVYDKYEVERQKLGRERILILRDYADNYETMSNSKADEVVNKLFKNEVAVTQLQARYYNKLKKMLNAIQSARSLQIESYIQSRIRSVLQGELAYIVRLDSLKSN